MSRAEIRRAIDHAWSHLLHTCNRDSKADRLFQLADRESMRVEREHRRFAPNGWKHAFPVHYVARYFVLREVLRADDPKPPTSWLGAAEIRSDIAAAWALRDLLRQDHDLRDRWHATPGRDAIAAIDYVQDMGSGAAKSA